MNIAAVSNVPSPNTSALSGLLARLKVGLAVTGWLGLILGSIFGLIAARPELLANNLADRWRLELLYRVGVMLIIGLIEGFAVRRVMRDTHDLARFLTAMVGVLLAAVSFEVIDSQPEPMAIFFELISREFQRLMVLLMFIGSGAILASMYAWRGVQIGLPIPAAAMVAPASSPTPRASSPPAAPRRERQSRQRSQPTPSSGHIARRPPAQERAVNRAQQARRASSSRTSPQRIEVQPRMHEAPPKPTRARRKPKVKLKLGRTVTSICPYCLDEVLPNDPHGRMVCRVCGTPHHGDCWAITGRCAVPHGS